MKKFRSFTWMILTGIVLFGISSCQKDELLSGSSDESTPELKSRTLNTFYSSTRPVGNGVARAWIQVNKQGEPQAVGINLSEKALEKLPDEPAAWVLELPKNKGENFYTHVLFDWNPGGHEPPGIYDLPHFDFHFYTIPSEEREAIPGMAPPYFDPAPAPQYIPPNYFELPGLIPGMGAHWANATAPELQMPPLAIFTQTFIWGSYEGEFIFWEPMITRDYLLSKPDVTLPIPQPTAYQNDGWYATDYKISYSDKPGEYTIALVNLQWQDGQ